MTEYELERLASNLGKPLSRRRFMNLAGGLAGVVLVAGLALAGCAQQPAPAPAAPTAAPPAAAAPAAAPAKAVATAPAAPKGPVGKLTIATGADLDNFDPHASLSTPNKGLIKGVFEALVSREEEPLLATSWKLIDNQTWQFQLRQGVKFHNGDPFNAEAVKFSLARYMDPKIKAPFASQLGSVKSIQAVDNYTVKITTDGPFGTLLDTLSDVEMVSPRAVQESGGDAGKKPVGTGPFKFMEWVPTERTVLEANDAYWGTPALVKTVVWRPIPEASTRVVALRNGEVDIITGVPVDQASAISGSGMKLERIAAKSQIPVTLNAKDKPFSDLKVRQALNYAVDKEELVKVILQGAGQVSNGLLTPSHPGYDASMKPYPYDPAQAKKLLAEAGYPDGFSATFNSPRGRFTKDQQIAEALSGQLAKVGIKLTANAVEFTTLLKVYRTEGQGFILPANLVTSQKQFDNYINSQKKGVGYYGYVNAKVDELLDQASKTFERDKRLVLYSQVSKIVRDEAAFLFLYDEQHLYGVRDRVKNFKPRGDELITLQGIAVDN